jgi:hypothetical protein
MNDQVCVSPLGGYGGGCSGGGVVVNVGDGGDGGAGGTFSGAASSILPVVDFSTLTTAQKAQIVAIVTAGGGGGGGGAEGALDGIGSAFDINTITPVQKAAITAIVAAGLDFSTLSAAQKAQIEAIAGAGAGTGGTLTAPQLSALMTTLFTPGATGSILQKQADGTIQAKPVLSTLPNGTAKGDSVAWNDVANIWEVRQPALSIAGLKTTYALVQQSTVSNPIAFVEGTDSAGNPTKAALANLPITAGTPQATNTISFAPTGVADTALISKVTAPAKGRYIIRYRAGYGIDPSGGTEPKGANKHVDANIFVNSPTVGQIANNTMTSNRPAIEDVAPIIGSGNKNAYGNILLVGSSGPFDLNQGDVVNMSVLGAGNIYNSPTPLSFGLKFTEYFPPTLELVKIDSQEIVNL